MSDNKVHIPSAGEDVKLPEANVNGQFTNSELRAIDRFVSEVGELVVDRKGLLVFIHKQRQEVLFRERQLLAALKENAPLQERVCELEEAQDGWVANAMGYKGRAEQAEAALAQKDEEIARLVDLVKRALHNMRGFGGGNCFPNTETIEAELIKIKEGKL